MAENSDVRRLKDEMKKKEKNKIDLEENLRMLEEEPKDHDENYQKKIHDLEKEIKRLEKIIEELKKEIKGLENRNTILDEKVNELDAKVVSLEGKNKKFELSEDELVIRQLCSSVQENLSRIVLQENFDKFQNKRTQDMENYISWQIKDEKEQDKARLRWEELKKETKWDEYLLRQLKTVKNSGNETAHPPLTEKDIDDAKRNLKEKKKLGKYNVEAVDQLKVIWIQTNRKLPQGFEFPCLNTHESSYRSSSNRQEQGAPRMLSPPRQYHAHIRSPIGTYASEAAGGRGDYFGPRTASGIQSFSRFESPCLNIHESSYRSSSNRQEQGGPRMLSTARQNYADIRSPIGTYASENAGGWEDDFGPRTASGIQSFSRSSTKGQDQGGSRFVSTARRNYAGIRPHNDTYASKAAGGREDDFSLKKASGRRSFLRYAFLEKGH